MVPTKVVFMRSSYMKSMRYTEHGAMDVHIDLILTMRKTYCRGPPSDGIGATVKSSANRSILTSGTTLSSAEDFFNFHTCRTRTVDSSFKLFNYSTSSSSFKLFNYSAINTG